MNAFIFSISSNSFVLAWLLLLIAIFLPTVSRWRAYLLWTGGRFIPIALFIGFLTGVISASGLEPKGNMFTFDGVVTLFSVPERLLNMWMEVMAFSLLIGRWIIDDGMRRRLPRWALIPCHLVLFISGGFAVLLYLVVLTSQGLFRRHRVHPVDT